MTLRNFFFLSAIVCVVQNATTYNYMHAINGYNLDKYEIGMVANFVTNRCPKGWMNQEVLQVNPNFFTHESDTLKCSNQAQPKIADITYSGQCYHFKSLTQSVTNYYTSSMGTPTQNSQDVPMVTCVKTHMGQLSEPVYRQHIEELGHETTRDLKHLSEDDDRGIIIAFSFLIVIIIMLLIPTIFFLFKLKKEKGQVVQTMPQPNKNIELDQEYMELSMKGNKQQLEQSEENQAGINQDIQDQINNCKSLLQNGNLRDKNQQMEIEQLQQQNKNLQDQNEAIRIYQEEVIVQKQEEIEMREMDLIDKQEAIQKKQDLIQDQVEEIQELQDQLAEKVLQETQKEVEPPLEEMTEEDLQIKLIKKRKEKKDRGGKFIGDLKQKIYDAINKQKIFHNKEKEIVRVNAFTELYSQFNTSFNNLNIDGQPRIQKAMETFHKGMKGINDKRIQKIEPSGKDGNINYKALIKKYILAIEGRAKDYFDLLKRLSQRYDMAIVEQLREQTAFLLKVQEIFMIFNDTMNILSNNDLMNNVNLWFEDLITLIQSYSQDIQYLDGEINILETQLKKVKAAGTNKT